MTESTIKSPLIGLSESRFLMNSNTRAVEILMKWAEDVARKGGGFSIRHAWEGGDWWTYLVVNWPVKDGENDDQRSDSKA